MGILDGPLRNVAQTLLSKFGQNAKLKRVTTGVFQAENDAVANTNVAVPVKALVPSSISKEAKGLVKEGDKVVLIAAAEVGVAPQPKDLFELDGREHEIALVTPTMSGDQAALYELVLRGQ